MIAHEGSKRLCRKFSKAVALFKKLFELHGKKISNSIFLNQNNYVNISLQFKIAYVAFRNYF